MRSACVLLVLFSASCFVTAQTNATLAGLTLRHTILITGGGSAGSTAELVAAPSAVPPRYHCCLLGECFARRKPDKLAPSPFTWMPA